MKFTEEAGWVGGFTREQAEGAIQNGSTIVKVWSERGDTHPVGTKGTVLGSIHHPQLGYLYFVEWETLPRVAVGVIGEKIGAMQ